MAKDETTAPRHMKQEASTLRAELLGRPLTGGAAKNTRRWCRGKLGREHTPVTTRNQADRIFGFLMSKQACGVPSKESLWNRGFECWHNVECSTCGKVLRNWYEMTRDDCPDAE